MARINPRRMWFWIAMGGLVGALSGAVRGDMDAYTGFLMGMLIGWCSRSLLMAWLWTPPSRPPPWTRQKEASAPPTKLGQGGDGQAGQQHPQTDEEEGTKGRDLEHPRH